MDFILVALLPAVFMLHDFEEIICFKLWIAKNETFLREKFPKLFCRISPVFNLSTTAFAIAVAEEFVLLNLVTFGSLYFSSYYLWMAAFMGFFIHLFVHFAQWVAVRRYIPAIITTLLCLPYCGYTFCKFILTHFSPFEIAVWTIAGLIIVGVNLVIAHRIAMKFNKL
jgi:hypothetical protein